MNHVYSLRFIVAKALVLENHAIENIDKVAMFLKYKDFTDVYLKSFFEFLQFLIMDSLPEKIRLDQLDFFVFALENLSGSPRMFHVLRLLKNEFILQKIFKYICLFPISFISCLLETNNVFSKIFFNNKFTALHCQPSLIFFWQNCNKD